MSTARLTEFGPLRTVCAQWHDQAATALIIFREREARERQAQQILALAKAGGPIYIKNGKQRDPGGVDFDLLRSSGALATPSDQERSGIARSKARRQTGNAKRLMAALWRYLTGPRAW